MMGERGRDNVKDEVELFEFAIEAKAAVYYYRMVYPRVSRLVSRPASDSPG